MSKDCPGCHEREAGPYCIEVNPGVMWPVPGTALRAQGQMMVVEKFVVPVWLCKECFTKMYDHASAMVHQMVKNVPTRKIEKES